LSAPVPDRVDFNFHIRPLLSDRCFACHGPDDKARKGGLSFLSRDAAICGGKSGKPSLVPGKPDDSELFRRLVTTDPDDHMPPAESKLPKLTPSEIETIRRWIAQGGEFKEHWAFLPLQSVTPPATGTTATTTGIPDGNDIDRFVVDRLRPEGLALQPSASRETLIRRLALDLTGLPPSPTEIDAFLADDSPQAYEKLLATLGATDAGEAVLEVPALEKLLHDRPDNRPPEAIPLLVTLLVDRLKLRKEALDQFVEWRLVRVPGTINAAGLLGPTEHT